MDFFVFLTNTVGATIFLAPLLAVMTGLVIGIIFGLLPGLGPLLGVTLAIPFTFSLDPVTGIALLMGIYQGGSYGGAITAIVLGIPGTPIAAATLLDGRPMALNGKVNEAISLATLASWFGGIISGIILLIAAPKLASVALAFGPAEIFALALLGLTAIATLSQGAVIKGLLSGIAGLLLATVGTDQYTGVSRFDFGMQQLSGGLTFVAVLVGLFAISEVLIQIETPIRSVKKGLHVRFRTNIFRSLGSRFSTYISSSVIGVCIGVIPGIGGVVSSFLSYKFAQETSRNGCFGEGEPRGVIATEAANSASTGGSLLPMLSVGIPGDPIVAVMMGGMLVHGLTPGPMLFFTNIEILDQIFLMFIAGAILLLPLGILLLPAFSWILRIPQPLLIAFVAMLATYGTFTVNHRFFDLQIMLVFGFLGYFMRKTAIPASPLIIGFVLGPVAEVQLRRMTAMAGDSPGTYLMGHPLAATILLFAFLSLMLPIIRTVLAARR